jgi:adenosylcobyric acid synthase
MIQGTGSDVGKSLLVAGLCRAAVRRGVSVAPSKPQNMSNNAAVTEDGGEIGRAQALQAQAARLAPHSDMNPVLLKPESDTGSQVILQGQRLATAEARDYGRLKPRLLEGVLDSFARLCRGHELIVVEGAGSAAEINLRQGDIANMGFARAAGVPVILAGDIDRGGVISQIVGTHAVLPDDDRAIIAGFLVNRFRGDPRLFDDGYSAIGDRTCWRGYGVLPWFADAWRLPAKDALTHFPPSNRTGLHVVCLALSRIANFDDLDPLAAEPGVRLTLLGPGRPIPGDADVVILPGSKSTRADLRFLRAQGWDIDILAHRRRGGHVLGLCGGYQMLGREVADPDGVEGPPGTEPGLGLLDLHTVLKREKRLAFTEARHEATGEAITGYEIHLGRTGGPDTARPFARVAGTPEGAVSVDGRVAGTYLHGVFGADAFRAAWLWDLGVEPLRHSHAASVEETLDALARHMERHFDMDDLFAAARVPGNWPEVRP